MLFVLVFVSGDDGQAASKINKENNAAAKSICFIKISPSRAAPYDAPNLNLGMREIMPSTANFLCGLKTLEVVLNYFDGFPIYHVSLISQRNCMDKRGM